MPSPLTGRVINGNVYDYSSITATIGNIPFQGITEISYSESLEPGELRGTTALLRGRTRGNYKAESSFTVGKKDFEAIKWALKALGPGGYGEIPFLITVVYAETNDSEVITDKIEGCRIMKAENSHSSGNNDPLVVKVDLSVFRICSNGTYMVNETGTPALIAPGV
jgi:hypothetical protein